MQGFLERSKAGGWQLLLPQPVVLAERRVNVLAAHGDAGAFPRLQDRFVKAVGRVVLAPGEAALELTDLREVEPDGTGRSTIHPSFTQSAVITLAAIPNTFVWRLPDGQPSGVQPLLMYTILNHGQAELEFMFRTNDVVCVDVGEKGGEASWHTSIPARTRNQERVVIRLGGVYRHFIPIAPDAAPRPGRYVARVTLCGVADYAVETEFAVLAPEP